MAERNDDGPLTAEDVRGLAFKASSFADGAAGYFMQQYIAKERPEIIVVVTGYQGRNDVKRTIHVGEQEFPDGEFQAVADAYNTMLAQRSHDDG